MVKTAENYPNPFNPSTIIRFAIPKESKVEIDLFNLEGELIKTLLREEKSAGFYQFDLNLSSFASGTYFYRIKAFPSDNSGVIIQTKKLILLK